MWRHIGVALAFFLWKGFEFMSDGGSVEIDIADKASAPYP